RFDSDGREAQDRKTAPRYQSASEHAVVDEQSPQLRAGREHHASNPAPRLRAFIHCRTPGMPALLTGATIRRAIGTVRTEANSKIRAIPTIARSLPTQAKPAP